MNNPYTTHSLFLKTLLESVSNDKKLPILELGCGDGSTPILREYCKENGIDLITLDNNIEWLNKMKGQFPATSFHKYLKVSDWETSLKSLPSDSYFITFIDQSPWEARTMSVSLFKDISDYVILHDCDYFPVAGVFGKVISPNRGPGNPGQREYSDVFKNYIELFPKDWAAPTGPPTLIASQFHADFIEKFNTE